MNLLRVSQVDGAHNFPLRASTLYKWAHVGKHQELFVRIGGALFINLDKFWAMAAAGQLASRDR